MPPANAPCERVRHFQTFLARAEDFLASRFGVPGLLALPQARRPRALRGLRDLSLRFGLCVFMDWRCGRLDPLPYARALCRLGGSPPSSGRPFDVRTGEEIHYAILMDEAGGWVRRLLVSRPTLSRVGVSSPTVLRDGYRPMTFVHRGEVLYVPGLLLRA